MSSGNKEMETIDSMNGTHKVYICDDEIWICRSIAKMLLSSGLPVSVGGQFQNGLHAYEQIVAVPPQILITDIRMPGFDGIELIQKVKALKNDVRMIVISGYDDFAYVQRALRYGVVDYILKPIKRNELYQSVGECVASIELQQAKDSAEALLPELVQKLALDTVLGENRNVKKLYEILNVFEDSRRVIAVGEFMYNSDAYACAGIVHHLQAALSQQSAQGILVPFERNRGICGFLYIDSIPASACAELFLQAIKKMSGQHQNNIALAIGEFDGKTENLREAYENASLRLRQRKLSQFGFVKQPTAANGVIADMKKKRSLLIAAIQLQDKNKVIALTADFVKELETGEDISHRQACMLFTSTVFDVLEILYAAENAPAELIDSGTAYYSFAENYISMEQVHQRFLAYCLEAMAFFIQENQRGGSNEAIGRVMQFIAYHYQDHITLTSLADEFHINASYLSTLFKQKTGVNFSEYITDVRLEKAASHLCGSAVTISDIALLVGYDDVRYFSKQFKKKYGCIPTVYRKANSPASE